MQLCKGIMYRVGMRRIASVVYQHIFIRYNKARIIKLISITVRQRTRRLIQHRRTGGRRHQAHRHGVQDPRRIRCRLPEGRPARENHGHRRLRRNRLHLLHQNPARVCPGSWVAIGSPGTGIPSLLSRTLHRN